MPEKKGPGLTYEPPPDALTGFGSLMPPPPPKQPSALVRLLKLPFTLIALPFKIVGRILAFPFRLFRSNNSDKADDSA
ncbi:MAG: hypothetical protein ACE367_14195 [Acidimicrobiales bacterium]